MNKSKQKLTSLLSAPVSILLFSACTATMQEGRRRDENREALTDQAITFLKNCTQASIQADIQQRQEEGIDILHEEIKKFYGLKQTADLVNNCSEKELIFMQLLIEIKSTLFGILAELRKIDVAESSFERSERIDKINSAYVDFTEGAIEALDNLKTKACEASLEIIRKIQSETVIVF